MCYLLHEYRMHVTNINLLLPSFFIHPLFPFCISSMYFPHFPVRFLFSLCTHSLCFWFIFRFISTVMIMKTNNFYYYIFMLTTSQFLCWFLSVCLVYKRDALNVIEHFSLYSLWFYKGLDVNNWANKKGNDKIKIKRYIYCFTKS